MGWRRTCSLVAVVVLIGCASAACVQPPTANADFDYQLGGAYPPPAGVSIVSRDREEAPVAGLYNICYVNGFQIQPDEEDFLERLRDALQIDDDRADELAAQLGAAITPPE